MADYADRHHKLVSFIQKTLKLFKSYIDYNQSMALEFKSLQQISMDFEIDSCVFEESFAECSDLQPNKILIDQATNTDTENAHIYGNYASQDYLDDFSDQDLMNNSDYFMNSNLQTDYQTDFIKTEKIYEPETSDNSQLHCAFNVNSSAEHDTFERIPPNILPISNESLPQIERSSQNSDIDSQKTDKQPNKSDQLNSKRKFISSYANFSNINETAEEKILKPGQRKRSKKLICMECNKFFHSPSHLKIHQRTHSNERPFKCPMCDMSFTTSGNMKVHQRVHSDERPYTCDECHMTFKLFHHLKDHRLKHGNDRGSRSRYT